MAFLGQAAVAMWWNIAPEHREEFEHWHSHEHFPERMGIPGFLRGSYRSRQRAPRRKLLELLYGGEAGED